MIVLSNTAVSLDGRIASVGFDHVELGTRTDRAYMSVLRSRADAVLVGGRTFRNWPLPLVPDWASIQHLRDRSFPDTAADPPRERWWNVVVTRGGPLPASPRFWSDPRVRPLVLSEAPVEIPAGEAEVGDTSVTAILDALRRRGVQTLLLEAGGDLLAQFFAADVVDEVYLTLCPCVVGGRGAPSLADGAGLDPIRRFHLAHAHRVGDELYLRYTR